MYDSARTRYAWHRIRRVKEDMCLKVLLVENPMKNQPILCLFNMHNFMIMWQDKKVNISTSLYKHWWIKGISVAVAKLTWPR